MRKSDTVVPSQKKVACPIQERGEQLLREEEFRYVAVLFISEGKKDWEISTWLDVEAVVLQALSHKAKLLIYHSVSLQSIWQQVLGNDWKNGKSRYNQGAWPHSLWQVNGFRNYWTGYYFTLKTIGKGRSMNGKKKKKIHPTHKEKFVHDTNVSDTLPSSRILQQN